MRIFSILMAVLASVTLLASGVAAGDRYGQQKVVYHINYTGGDGDKAYRGAMKNIQNHINAVGAENLDIKVVLHGNGLGLLLSANEGNDQLQVAVAGLKAQEVKFHVCANTLKGRKISYEEDLYDVYEEDIVPSGVAELSHLQQMGYTYIKP